MKSPKIGKTDRKLPSQNRSRARVQNILKAAEELLLIANLDDITTSTIAKQADIPVGSVYQYFKERDSVLVALGQNVIQQINDKLEAVFSEVSQHAHWRHVVRETLNAYMQIHLEDQLYYRLQKALHNNQEWIKLNLTMEEQMVVFFSKYGLLEQRGIPAEERQVIVRMIVMMCAAVILRAKELASEQRADRYLVELQEAVIAYLGNKLGD